MWHWSITFKFAAPPFTGCSASGGALALEPPRATRFQPEPMFFRKFTFSQKFQVEPTLALWCVEAFLGLPHKTIRLSWLNLNIWEKIGLSRLENIWVELAQLD